MPELGNSSSSGSGDIRLDWMLTTDIVSTVSIAYAAATVEVNKTGTLTPYVLSGTSPVVSYSVTSGSLPPEFTLDTTTGVISYTTTGAVSSGTFSITATTPVGDSDPYVVNWEIKLLQGISQFSNSENIYPFMRITTSKSTDSQYLLKSTFFGRTTSTGDGTLIEDADYPIYYASNGNGTWNYMIFPTGYTYWMLYVNTTTDPASLANGVVTDLSTSSAYDLVCPTSDNITGTDGKQYPSDQTDVHWGAGINYFSLGNDASLNGFMADNTSFSFGFKLVDAWPTDSLGRAMFSRAGRNFIAAYLGHNATYTNSVVGNGSIKTYDGENTYPSSGFAAGTYIRVTFNNGTYNIYADGVLTFSYSASSYLDGSTSTDALDVLFGTAVSSNDPNASNSTIFSNWQGKFERLWISNGVVETTDDNGLIYPAGVTHSWAMNETTGGTFTPTDGSITITGMSA